jgi:PAS domain S-box-containing protein
MLPYHISLLESELQKRKDRNSRYSLRAFASFLGIDPSALSRILHGKQELSVQLALQVVLKLNLQGEEQERFIGSVAREKYVQTLQTLGEGVSINQLTVALQESEERYRALHDVVDQMVSISELIRDPEGKAIDARLLRVNPAWEKQTGISRERAVGHLISELIPKGLASWLELFDRVVQTRQPERVEKYLPDLDQWYDILVTPIEDDRYMSIGKSTTERHRQDERQTFLIELNDVLSSVSDPTQVQFEATRLLAERLQASRSFYTEVSEDESQGVVQADFRRDGRTPSLKGNYSFSTFRTSLELSRLGPVIIPDTQSFDRFSEVERVGYAAISIGSILFATHLRAGKVVALLSVSEETPREWKPLEIELVQLTAERTWGAVERARAEVALRKSEAALAQQSRFLDATFTALPDCVYAFGPDLRLIYTNRAMQTLFGLTNEEMVGRSFAELGYPPELVFRLDSQMEKLFRDGKSIEDETEFTSPTGITAVFHYLWNPVRDENGEVVLGVGVSRDTTERHRLARELHESELRLKATFETLPIALAVLDEKAVVLLANPAMKRFLPTGIAPSQDATHAPRWQAQYPDGTSIPRDDFPCARALRGIDVVPGIEMQFSDGGPEVRIRVASRPLKGGEGRATGAILIVETLDRAE